MQALFPAADHVGIAAHHRVESNQRDAVTGIGQQRVDSPAADRVVEEIVIVEIGEIALDDVDYGAVPRKDSAANGRAAMNPRLLDVGWVRWSKRGAFIARHRGKASAKRGLVIAES